MIVDDYRTKIQDGRAKLSIYQQQKVDAASKILTLQALKKDLDEAQAFVQVVAKETQEQIRYNLEDIMNTLLTAVYGDMYEFKLIYETKRNRTEARIALLEQGAELDPLASVGGGVADILSTGLRIALLLLSKNRRTLILDEPGKFLSESLRPVYYEVLRSLTQDVGIQIVAITHDKLFMEIADRVYRVRKDGGVSYATERI